MEARTSPVYMSRECHHPDRRQFFDLLGRTSRDQFRGTMFQLGVLVTEDFRSRLNLAVNDATSQISSVTMQCYEDDGKLLPSTNSEKESGNGKRAFEG
jgi:hypothetical protein